MPENNSNNENLRQDEEQFVDNILTFLSDGTDSLERQEYDQNWFSPSVGGGLGGMMFGGDPVPFNLPPFFSPSSPSTPTPTETPTNTPSTPTPTDTPSTPTNTPTNTPTTDDPGPATPSTSAGPATPGPTKGKP